MGTSTALPWTLALLLVLGVGAVATSHVREHLLRAGIGAPVVVATSGELETMDAKPPRERHRTERARRPVQRSTRPPSYDW